MGRTNEELATEVENAIGELIIMKHAMDTTAYLAMLKDRFAIPLDTAKAVAKLVDDTINFVYDHAESYITG